ncbi:hypothetical protein [Dyella flagellata]|uniref:Uncharacterized protein n=1 Tax=Dyella flagellata TaxID=1867833 RepID=A0ABQ5X6H4_9GAMM|nr:hypothetical protein [Dyella flagellata]GLQ86716.1 hypothetical protein GCM10007898_02820 [Dyella flagellata]
MVSKNSTTRARPSETFWLGEPPRFPKDPQRNERYAYLMKFAGTSVAIQVIRGLLKSSEAFNRAKAYNRLPEPGALPLTPTQVDGLCAALYFLHRHGDAMLMKEHES